MTFHKINLYDWWIHGLVVVTPWPFPSPPVALAFGSVGGAGTSTNMNANEASKRTVRITSRTGESQ